MAIVNLTKEQKSYAEKETVEENHTSLFICGSEQYVYGCVFGDLENELLG